MTRNITLSLPEELIREAKICAARRDMSLSALMREALENTVSDWDAYQKAAKWLLEKAETPMFDIEPGTWNRDELHERRGVL